MSLLTGFLRNALTARLPCADDISWKGIDLCQCRL